MHMLWPDGGHTSFAAIGFVRAPKVLTVSTLLQPPPLRGSLEFGLLTCATRRTVWTHGLPVRQRLLAIFADFAVTPVTSLVVKCETLFLATVRALLHRLAVFALDAIFPPAVLP